ncbi:MAG: hypothetical protein R3266_07475, partial [Gemmatimonadota bacterium]|nr:hypothetical protein [Gemmatimonadota bacterium]
MRSGGARSRPAPGSRPSSSARPFLYIGVLLILLSIGRAALWAAYPSHFADLGGAETLSAFARGLRFDISTACWTLGLPVWFLLWPARFARGRTWQAIWGWTACALILLALVVVATDLVYFSLARRHI